MSPRGVAIPELREQLFEAADRVLARDGAAGLTGRAVTRESGVATGLLYRHFPDFDQFLAEYVMDRVRDVGRELARLAERAGAGSVVDNVTDAAMSMLGSNALALGGLVLTRPAVATKMGAFLASGTPELHAGEPAFTSYLDREKQLGRIGDDKDTEAIALALMGAVHQIVLTHRPGAPDPRPRVRNVVIALGLD